MKISFIRRAYSPSGGAEKYLLRLANALHEKGLQSELITAAEWPEDTWQWGNIKHLNASSPLEFANSFKQIKPSLDSDHTLSLERVWAADFYRAGDGVHAAWLNRLKQSHSSISNFFRTRKSKHQQILELEASLYSPDSSTKIIANSHLVATEIKSIFKTPEENIKVIYNGYSPREFNAEEVAKIRKKTRQQFSLKDDDCVVLFVGSGWKRKGAGYLAQAIKKLNNKNVKLLVAGKGKPSIHSPNIHYLGVSKDIPSLCLASDIFVLPTLYDPFSNACLEAASYGLPVITTKDNGFSEAINKFGGGSVVSHGSNIDDLSSEIKNLLDHQKRDALKPQLKKLSQYHTMDRNLKSTLKFIES
ncbi:MAG: UDP-glucose:(heptosyl)LPS alpha-1,3-glucosyltransferase [Cryomorphaceae bacterium]|jgi:UDP-glucose:(heptosyl)LPS alpha-1,3-glucosyltransferase